MRGYKREFIELALELGVLRFGEFTLKSGRVRHKTDHVVPIDRVRIPRAERVLGERLAKQLITEKAIMGVFDEGCMGMFNAIIPDHLLNPIGVFKERLSQSALYRVASPHLTR